MFVLGFSIVVDTFLGSFIIITALQKYLWKLQLMINQQKIKHQNKQQSQDEKEVNWICDPGD